MGRISHPSYVLLSLINASFVFDKKKSLNVKLVLTSN